MSGADRSLETFIKEYEWDLRHTARRLGLGHGVDADDLYSATCLALVRHWPLGVEDGEPPLSRAVAYMFNTMRDLRKAQTRRMRWLDPRGALDEADEPVAPPAREPEHEAIVSDEEREVARLIGGLGRALDREVTSLRWEGFSLREIAELTDTEVTKVRAASDRARKAMKASYRGGGR